MTYSTLKENIKHYCRRDESIFENEIPDLIVRATERIMYDGPDSIFSIIDTALLRSDPVSGNPTNEVLVPSNYRDTLALLHIKDPAVGGTSLQVKSKYFCEKYFRNSTGNEPKYYSYSNVTTTYADIDPNNDSTSYVSSSKIIHIYPTPTEAIELLHIYTSIPKRLGPFVYYDEEDKKEKTVIFEDNVLTIRYPRLLFYATLIECMLYLGNEEKVPPLEQVYAQELNNIKTVESVIVDDEYSKIIRKG